MFKFALTILTVALCVLARPARAVQYLDLVASGAAYELAGDSILSARSVIEADELRITNSLYLENRGLIASDIFLCDGCELQLRNSGEIRGAINLGVNSSLTQIVNTARDLTRVHADGGHRIIVSNKDDIELSDVLRISGGADIVILDNARISVHGRNPVVAAHQVRSASNGTAVVSDLRGDTSPRIELVGYTVIDLDYAADTDGAVILQNVSGAGGIEIHANGLHRMYKSAAVLSGGDMYVRIMRELDYEKILIGDPRGNFLNKVRTTDPGNKTLRALDGAANMRGLHRVMDDSVMFHPLNLIRPIRAFENFEINDFSNPDTNTAGAAYVASGDFDMQVTRISVGSENLRAAAYAGHLKNSGDTNDFSGMFYGANLCADINYESLWMHSTAGLTVSLFESGMIFDGGNGVTDPRGLSVYGVTDFGLRFGKDMHIDPFLGMAANYGSVLSSHEFGHAGRIGAHAGFKSDANGIVNEYDAFAVAQTDGAATVGVSFGIWSVLDGVGAKASYAIMRDRQMASHKAALEIKFRF